MLFPAHLGVKNYFPNLLAAQASIRIARPEISTHPHLYGSFKVSDY